jgi:hypothetical protein
MNDRIKFSQTMHFKSFYTLKSYLYFKVTDVEGTWKLLVSVMSYGNSITFIRNELPYFASLYH